VNVIDLNRFEDGTEVTLALLMHAGLVRKAKDGLKILGKGELERKLLVVAHKVSDGARGKIEARAVRSRRPRWSETSRGSRRSRAQAPAADHLYAAGGVPGGAHVPTPASTPPPWRVSSPRHRGISWAWWTCSRGRAAAHERVRPRHHAYISASIILQLLTVVVPTLEKLSKEGSRGARRSRSGRVWDDRPGRRAGLRDRDRLGEHGRPRGAGSC